MRIRNLALAASAVFLFSACDSDAPAEPMAMDVTGTYELHTVDGAELPFRLEEIDEDNRTDLTAGSITLNSDGTYTDVSNTDVVVGGELSPVVETHTGTYSVDGSGLHFTPIDGPPHTAVIDPSDGLITSNVNGNAYAYRAM